MKKRWRMCSAMAFIKSCGTPFPTQGTTLLPTSRIAVYGQLTILREPEITASAINSAA